MISKSGNGGIGKLGACVFCFIRENHREGPCQGLNLAQLKT